MRGTIGWPSYPAREPSTLDFTHARTARQLAVAALEGGVVPRCVRRHDGAAAVAVEDGTEPEISGRDNLETIALCEAVFAAATRAPRDDRAASFSNDPDLRIAQAIVLADARGRGSLRNLRISMHPRPSGSPYYSARGQPCSLPSRAFCLPVRHKAHRCRSCSGLAGAGRARRSGPGSRS